MTKEDETANLIERLYPEPDFVYKAPARKPFAPVRSINEVSKFGAARIKGYNLVMDSFMDPNGKFHQLESYEQQLLAVRCGLIEGSSPVVIKDVAREFGISATHAQDIINLAIIHLDRK